MVCCSQPYPPFVIIRGLMCTGRQRFRHLQFFSDDNQACVVSLIQAATMAQCLDSKAFLGNSTAFKSAQTARSNVVSYLTLSPVQASEWLLRYGIYMVTCHGKS